MAPKTTSTDSSNPFIDPDTSFEGGRGSFAVDATLAVGKNASLTLGTDALIVLGASPQRFPGLRTPANERR